MLFLAILLSVATSVALNSTEIKQVQKQVVAIVAGYEFFMRNLRAFFEDPDYFARGMEIHKTVASNHFENDGSEKIDASPTYMESLIRKNYRITSAELKPLKEFIVKGGLELYQRGLAGKEIESNPTLDFTKDWLRARYVCQVVRVEPRNCTAEGDAFLKDGAEEFKVNLNVPQAWK